MKRVYVVVAIVTLVAAAAIAHDPSDCPKWWEGATLLQATSQEWKVGSDRDRLATAATWAYQFIKDMSPPIELADEVLPFAIQLRICVDLGLYGTSTEITRASDLATFCTLTMKDSFQVMLGSLDKVRRARAALP